MICLYTIQIFNKKKSMLKSLHGTVVVVESFFLFHLIEGSTETRNTKNGYRFEILDFENNLGG